MSLLELANKDVVTLPPTATLHEAKALMKLRNIGSIVVTENKVPVGIITDRDLALRTIGKTCRPLNLKEVMTPDPVTLDERLSLFEALETMKDQGVRRFPVVNPRGELSGLFTLDDVLFLLGLELSAVASIIDRGSL